MNKDVQGCTDSNFNEVLSGLIGEFIIVIVKSGQNCDSPCGQEASQTTTKRNFDCCKHFGTLCQLGRDFLLLIKEGKKIYIPLNAVAAIIEKC